MFGRYGRSCPTFNAKAVLMDEIALDGLFGIGLERLWNCFAARTSTELSDKVKESLWNITKTLGNISYYKASHDMPNYKIIDRFSVIDEFGSIRTLKEPLDGDYEFAPVNNEYGSCKDYESREEVQHKSLLGKSYQEIREIYGDTLALVASTEERFHALAPHIDSKQIKYLTPLQYCLLELVGKSRSNGQLTTNVTNISKIINNAKMLFYHRRLLAKMDIIKNRGLITNEASEGRKMRVAIILRLKRFDKPNYLNCPKVGGIAELISKLQSSNDMHLLLQDAKPYFWQGIRLKDFGKNAALKAYFKLVEEKVPSEPDENKKKTPRNQTYYVTLNKEYFDKLSSDSDSETETVPIHPKRQKIGVSLAKQFLDLMDEHPDGISLPEFKNMLDIDYYNARRMYRTLKKYQLANEMMESQGRQKIGKLVALNYSSRVNELNKEKLKLVKSLNDSLSTPMSDVEEESQPRTTPMEGVEQIQDNYVPVMKEKASAITDDAQEVINSGKVTLKSLKIFNAIIKLVAEHQIIRSFSLLKSLMLKESPDLEFETALVKKCAVILSNSKQLRVIRLEHKSRSLELICSYNVTKNHPNVRKIYKEFSFALMRSAKIPLTPKMKSEYSRKNRQSFRIPKFAFLKRLHCIVFDIAYPESSSFPLHVPGFVSIFDIQQNLNVEEAYSLVCLRAMDIIDGELMRKHKHTLLSDAPTELRKSILDSHHLVTTIKLNLLQLASMGFLQICKEKENVNGIMQNSALYVNRNVSIVNTTGDWPVPCIVKRKRFQLNSSKDVIELWDTIKNISLRTKIKVPERLQKWKEVPSIPIDEVKERDNGNHVYGDGKGPCGFDSAFFLDHPKRWAVHVFAPRKQYKPMRKERIRPVKPKPAPVKKDLRVKHLPKPRRSLVWEPWEDKLLLLCRASQQILSSIPIPGAYKLTWQLARDIILKSSNKERTAVSCMGRMAYLERTEAVGEIEKIINKANEYPDLMTEFDALYYKLSSKKSKFFPLCKIGMTKFLLTYCKLVNGPYVSKNAFTSIADDFEDFHNKYSLVCVKNEDADVCKRDEQSVQGVQFMKVMETIVFALSSMQQGQTAPVLHTLAHFDDTVLKEALYYLHMVTKKISKSQNVYDSMTRLEAATYYKMSHLYNCKIENKSVMLILDEISKAMDQIVSGVEVDNNMSSALLIMEWCMSGKSSIDIVSLPKFSDCSDAHIELPETTTTFNRTIIDADEGVSTDQLKEILSDMKRKYVCNNDHSNDMDIEWDDVQNSIISFLEDQKEIGGTLLEICDKLPHVTLEQIQQSLQGLEDQNIIACVGFKTTRIILRTYHDAWTAKSHGVSFIPFPWLGFDHNINANRFNSWCTTILDIVLESSGSTCEKISEQLEHLHPTYVQKVVEFLQQVHCVKLYYVREKIYSLFDNGDSNSIAMSDYTSFCPPDSVVVVPLLEALSKFANVRKKLSKIVF